MDADFWLRRWDEGRIGFHQNRPTPLLLEFWHCLQAPPGCRVLVPLAGKSLDMAWLAAQGHRVLGVELSPLAVRQFFDEQGATTTATSSPFGTIHRAGPIEVLCGDAFALDAAALASCAAVLDRAALIALPEAQRRRYVGTVYARLPVGSRVLLITLEYPQHEKDGPPFSVDEAEVRALFDDGWRMDVLARRDILAAQPGFVAEGVSALATVVYALTRDG